MEMDAFGAELFEPSVEYPFFEFEIGDAVAHQAARQIVALEHGNVVAGTGKLLGRCKARGAGAYDCRLFSGFLAGQQRFNPALGKAPLDNLILDMADEDGLVVDGQSAGCLAGGWTYAAGNFGEVVGRMKIFAGLPPSALENKLIEFGDSVFNRASRTVAERDAAVGASGRLLFYIVRRKRDFDFAEIPSSFFD
jgi:hypothetical protein